jgi:predicted alpha/beta-fold hydrolase
MARTHDKPSTYILHHQKITNASPIVIFLYGGGLTRGDKILTDVARSLIYHNLGSFFALRDFAAIIPDYRRVDDPNTATGEGATYPSGDVAAVLEWLHSASCPLPSSNSQRDVFIIGNSAGGVHLATYLLDARFKGGRKRLLDGSSAYRLRGAVLLSVPLDFKSAKSERLETLDRCWPASLVGKSPSRSQELFCPNGLLNSLKNGGGAGDIAQAVDLGIPDLLGLLGEFDSEDN